MKSRKENSWPENLEGELHDLRRGLTKLGLDVTVEIIARFTEYLRILYSYRGKLHLLSRGDYERISRRHFLPSLTAIEYIRNHRRVCDVGAGAGFPSLPLKLVLPDFDLVVFESVTKKAHFLRSLVDRLGLEGVEIRNERAEDYTGEGFDLMLFKAVGKIGRMLRVVDRLLAPEGEAIFYKSPGVTAELVQAASVMKKRDYVAKIINVSTPIEELPLTLVILSRLR